VTAHVGNDNGVSHAGQMPLALRSFLLVSGSHHCPTIRTSTHYYKVHTVLSHSDIQVTTHQCAHI